ncbi:MAG: hypothetical protein AAFX00_12400 [Pseudomonadota bacterium]
MHETILDDALRFAHLASVALGLGVAAHTEMTALSRRYHPIDSAFLADLSARHRLIGTALLIMWVSGFGLITLKTGFSLAEMTPKLWAKLAAVSILSLNAALIGWLALPLLARGSGHRLCDLRPATRGVLFTLAGLSGGSWFAALALGSSTFAKTASAELLGTALPAVYVCAVATALIVGFRLTRDERTLGRSFSTQDVLRSSLLSERVPRYSPSGVGRYGR